MTAHLSHIAVVLYQPQDVVNVAAVIRVMSNFGLPQLRLVEPAAFDPYRIEGIAHGTSHIVANARRYATLAEALSDRTLVLGTTGRPRLAEHRIYTPREAAPLLAGRALAATPADLPRVAILFGREQDGLPNEALDLCHGIITIPTHPENRSLNLAQAALVVAYELWTAAPAAPAPPGGPVPEVAPDLTPLAASDLATGEERETIFGTLRDLLLTLYPNTTDARLENSLSRLRTLMMRGSPRAVEAEALTNLLRHTVRRLKELGRR